MTQRTAPRKPANRPKAATKAVPAAPRKAELTRQRILDCAEELFAARGVEGTSLRAIAEQAGMQAGNILHHFPDGKDELFNELVKTIFDELLGELAILGDKPAMPQSLLILTGQLWDYFAMHPKRARIVMHEAMAPHAGHLERGKQQAMLVSLGARSLVEQAIARQQIAPLDAEIFIIDALSFILFFHAAPALRNMLIEAPETCRERYLEQMKFRLAPASPG